MPPIEPGTKLIIKPLAHTASVTRPSLLSSFTSKMPNHRILFEAPTHKGVLYPVSINEPLQVSFTSKMGIHHFRCVVSERFTDGEMHYINARIVSRIQHAQRRKHLRVKETIPGEFTAWSRIDGEARAVRRQCLSYDISCGGMGLYTKEACETGDNLIVSVPIGPKKEVVGLYSEVRWRKNAAVDTYSYLIGVRFCYTDNTEREMVRNYVHQLQLTLNQR